MVLLTQIVWMLVASAAEPAMRPSVEQARLNAFPIFNSIHSAGRQWGSSLNHNGLAMIPARVPRGNLLYHGTHSSDVNQTGLEWLAFEPEHAEIFAISTRGAHQKFFTKGRVQQVLQDPDQRDAGSEIPRSTEQAPVRGYLRTYQASRDLNLLYFDGMSAAKGCLGTLDTQDLVLRLINGSSPCDHQFADIMTHDYARVGELCKTVTAMGYDGLLRMEAGFEVVYCDFDDGGLRLLNQLRRPFWDQMKTWYNISRLVFHAARAALQRYNGMVEAGRLQLDFSRMVSAYFYPVNITSPEIHIEGQVSAIRPLPRLLSTSHLERCCIQRRVREIAIPRGRPKQDWQAVVDAIISRYADRLALLAQLPLRDSDTAWFAAEIFVATNTYVDYPSTPKDVSAQSMKTNEDTAARTRCQRHYLQQVQPNESSFTPEDHLIYAAVTQVGRICETLFQARSRIQAAYQYGVRGKETSRNISRAVEISQTTFQRLVKELKWTCWETCGGCAIDEFCFLPMYPFGSTEDAQMPRCLNESGMGLGLNLSSNYWQVDLQHAFDSIIGPS